MSEEKIKLGLIGFGCVGEGVYRNIRRFYRDEIEVKRICIRQADKQRNAPGNLFTSDVTEIIRDPEITLVVEVINDSEAAADIITACLKAGKDIVTANKAAVANNLEAFINLQKTTGRTLLYEAAVAAAIPVIRVLETQYGREPIGRVEGILNGSTNYLLSKMRLEGMHFEDALAEAQQKGFAEDNPRLDIDGWDAAYKITILAAHAFGKIPLISDVKRTTFEAYLANGSGRSKNQKCIAEATPGPVAPECTVGFREVEPASAFSQIEYEKNAVHIQSEIAGNSTLIGLGAGADATASAILADIFQWQAGFRYSYRKFYEMNDKLPLAASF